MGLEGGLFFLFLLVIGLMVFIVNTIKHEEEEGKKENEKKK